MSGDNHNQADPTRDVIQVTGEMAQAYGVKPPLNGRIDFGHGNVFDLTDWVGAYDDSRPGRIAGTYIGRQVSS